MSLPTPPLSLIFIPGAFARASPRVLTVSDIALASMAVALKADWFILLNVLAVTTASPNCAAGRSVMSTAVRPPAFTAVRTSRIS